MYASSQQAIADEAKRGTGLRAGFLASDLRSRIEQLTAALSAG